MKRLLFFSAATLLVLSLTHPAQAQSAEEQAAQKAWMEYSTPGPVHQMLAKADGDWTYEMTGWMAPDAPPMKSSGTSTNRMILGGRYQESRHNGTFMNMPFEGVALTGYDNAKKAFVSSWMDNMGTGIMNMEGKYDEASKTITLTGKCIDPMTGKDMEIREVMQWLNDKSQKMEMYTKMDGKEFKSMEITYTRK